MERASPESHFYCRKTEHGTKSLASAKNDQNTQEELRLSRKYRRLLEQCETLSPQKTELLSLIADNLEK